MTDGNVDHASSRIRMTQYIPGFQNQGWKVRWIPRIALQKSNKLFFWMTKRVLAVKLFFTLLINRFDVVVIQRRLLNGLFRSLLRKQAGRIFFDLDDAIFLKEGNQVLFDETMAISDHIVVSTPELEKFLQHYGKPIHLIYSSVNANSISLKQNYELGDGKVLRIAWSGSRWTSHYLQEIHEALEEASKEVALRLVLIGAAPELHLDGVVIEHLPWDEYTEARVLPQCDLGIMPLDSSEWEQFKGGYKLFLYMAAGLPLLASPVGINQQIVRDGQNGYLPMTSREWKEKIILMAGNEQLRKELGQQAHRDFMNTYEYGKAMKQWQDLLETT